jgi:hypothetical protein
MKRLSSASPCVRAQVRAAVAEWRLLTSSGIATFGIRKVTVDNRTALNLGQQEHNSHLK